MRGDSSQLGAGLAEVGLAQNGVGKNLRVSRSTLGLSVFHLYCLLADPMRTVPGSLLMRRISLFLATSTPSKCASPTTLLTIVSSVVGEAHFDGVLVAKKREILLIRRDPGTVLIGSARRQ